jgi:16S rRNA (guanine527-N7)-methyltransferase
VEQPELTSKLVALKALSPLQLVEEQVQQLTVLAGLVLEWNSKVNLISRTGTDSIWTAHILHSMSALLVYPLVSQEAVLDMGTGGGFPGLPLAIARPASRFTLVDATGKKVRAVEDIAGRLGLTNVRTAHARVEELAGKKEWTGKFDLVTARAVAPLADLARWSAPLLRRSRTAGGGGDPELPVLLAYKGGDVEQEILTLKTTFPSAVVRTADLVFPPAAGLEGKKLVVVRL